MKKKTIIKIISIIFVLLWMILVFMLSNEVAIDSSSTSVNFIRLILKIFNCNVTENVLELLQPVIRKMAHFVLYTLGGILVYNMCLQLGVKKTKKKSFCIGMFYAITDEIHQLFVEGRSGEIRDVIIDSTGVVLGIIILSFIIYIVEEMKSGTKKKESSSS